LSLLGWPAFVRHLQLPGDINPAIHTAPHTAAAFLKCLATSGVPAPSTAQPWSQKQKRDVLQRGAHSSVVHQFRSFLWEDLSDMVAKGFWSVLPFAKVKHFSHLKLAPSGVVPQRTRRPRPIMDYTYTGVNQASAMLAPTHAMQFGNTFQRVLQRIAYANPSHGPVLLAKFDLSDGYYRVPLSPEAALELAVILPPLENHPPLVGIPLMLPMGWKLSPPYFCAFTETAADIANAALHTQTPLPPQHALEALSQLNSAPIIIPNLRATSAPDAIHQWKTPIAYTDVYMDDFIGISQPATAGQTLRAILWGIHSVFRGTPHPVDTPTRKQVISASKLAMGDGQWSTQKPILGWLVDTVAGTIHLLPHKAQRLHELLSTYLPLKRTSRKNWLHLLGELRHMATAIPGACYLFSLLQNVLAISPRRPGFVSARSSSNP